MARNTKEEYSNELIHESSPYLLQHAHNPVNWLPWGEKARQKARDENKPMLISIGYSACHWCHVMEKECFEDEEVATVMNDCFVCVKVDREERPDVDQVFMDAVQMMRQPGGWPLNCFTTPDGKPVFGGTYFPKDKWLDILSQLSKLWKSNPKKFTDYGNELVAGMNLSGGLPRVDSQQKFPISTLHEAIKNWLPRMDKKYGGPNKAPKFPLPVNYLFLLRYGSLTGNAEVLRHVECTLDKITAGGIFDQVGGGFARYSTDIYWKVPHFEKMLYDNAQLLSLFAEASHLFKKTDYLRVVNQISTWLSNEMENEAGGYFSALDADSEGEEGKYYTFEVAELRKNGLLESFEKYYYTDENARWEGKIIPVRKQSAEAAAENFQISVEDVKSELKELNQNLLKIRRERVRPGTDDKSICSWNAMLAEGFLTVYAHTGEEDFLKKADSIFEFIERNLPDSETEMLSHSWKNDQKSGIGFLEDYAFLISAYLKKVEIKFNPADLNRAKELAFRTLDAFLDSEKGLFYITHSSQTDLVARPVELNDNVMPSGNSVMAQNLQRLSQYFGNTQFEKIAERILNAVEKNMVDYPEGYGHFADLWLRKAMGTPELVIAGPDAEKFRQSLSKKYLPNFLWAASDKSSELPIFANRFDTQKTQIFVCQNKSCQLPVEAVEKAEKEIEKIRKSLENP